MNRSRYNVYMNLIKTASQRDRGSPFRYNDICDALRRHSVTIQQDLTQLLRLMLFNRAINNTDDHERNFSLINAGDGYRISPAYDLVPSLITGQYHVAGFDRHPNPPTPSDALQMARIFGLPKPVITNCVEEVLWAIGQWRDFAEAAGVSEAERMVIERFFHR